jgi:hypothetical protein
MSVQDLLGVVIHVFPVETSFTDQHVSFLFGGTLETDPGRPTLASLSPTRCTVPIARLVLVDDTRVDSVLLWLDDVLQNDAMLDPVAKVVDVFELLAWF